MLCLLLIVHSKGKEFLVFCHLGRVMLLIGSKQQDRAISQQHGCKLARAPADMQVVWVSWLTATVFFVLTYMSPCLPLPPKEQLTYFEAGGGEDQDFYAGISGADSMGLRYFPQLW